MTGSTLWVDGSNYTGTLTPRMCHDLKQAGYVGMIIQAITGFNGQTFTRQQLQMCLDQGLRIQGYVWSFGSVDVASRLRMFDGFRIEALWLDVEDDASTVRTVNRDLALCDAYMGRPTGVYSGKWMFDRKGWSKHRYWADRLLWNAVYDGVPDVNYGFVPYGGWTSQAIKQFAGTSSIGSLQQVDLNVMA